jgi:LysM repeat protein
MACLQQRNGLLLQASPGETISLTWRDSSLTLSGTVLYHPYPPASASLTETLTTLDGTALISVRGQTRIVPVGAQIILSLDDAGVVQNVSPQPLPYDPSLVEVATFNKLPRTLTLPTPIAPPEGYASTTGCTGGACPTLPPSTIRQASPSECVVRDDWDEARVQPGETLSSIASRFGLSAADLQKANCLNNPNRLQIGQILHVPPFATATPFAQPTFTPSIVAFRADSSTLTTGDCTTLRWDVQNISAVFIDEEPTSGNGVLPICPATTTTYTLRVVYPDGTQTQQPLRITVLEATPS